MCLCPDKKVPPFSVHEIRKMSSPVMQIVYVLTTTDKDSYLEQLYLSIRSLRLRAPRTRAVVITDEKTFSSLSSLRKEMMESADRIVVVGLDPSLSGLVRSRLLKTGMREFIDGDFLYIDTDTIICGDIETPDYLKSYEIGAVKDRHCDFADHPMRTDIIRRERKWFDLSDIEEYYNGGVFWVRDTPAVHDFFAMWNRLYTDGVASGCFIDQPSLGFTQKSLKLIRPLDDAWNVQSNTAVRHFGNARIFHYFVSDGRPPYHRFTDTEWMKRLSSADDDVRAEALSQADSIIEHFSRGYNSDITVIESGKTYVTTSPLFWFIVNNRHRRFFKIFDKFGAFLNRMFPENGGGGNNREISVLCFDMVFSVSGCPCN